jgi:hypothetical protein
MLPKNAKLYITLVIAAGSAVLLVAASSWSTANLKQFGIYLGLAVLASTLKIRIPGIESTVTPNFVFILLAINACSFPEVVAISLAAALTQSLWRSAKRPRLVQVAFSAAALILSASAAYGVGHLLSTANGNAWQSAIGTVIFAGCIYFPLNSALVAVVIGLVSGQSLGQTVDHAEGWLFPYFMGGIAFAGLITAGYDHSSSWRGAVILIPAVILAHIYYLNRAAHKLAPKPST